MDKKRLSYLGVAVNAVLLAMKMWAGIVSGSIAAVSDALNSLLDIFSYSALSYAVYVQDKEPDENHPFGHRRAEPLAGMIIAVLAAILGGAIIKDAVMAFFSDEPSRITTGVLVVLGVAVVIKAILAGLYYTVAKRTGSKGLMAGYVDSRNDVLTSSVVLLGVYVGGRWDELAAIAVGIWILYSGIGIGLENAGYLLGAGADETVIEQIRETAMTIRGVRGIDEVKAHFVGDLIHADVHIEVLSSITVSEAHDISERVKYAVDKLPEVDHTFVHVDIFRGESEVDGS